MKKSNSNLINFDSLAFVYPVFALVLPRSLSGPAKEVIPD